MKKGLAFALCLGFLTARAFAADDDVNAPELNAEQVKYIVANPDKVLDIDGHKWKVDTSFQIAYGAPDYDKYEGARMPQDYDKYEGARMPQDLKSIAEEVLSKPNASISNINTELDPTQFEQGIIFPVSSKKLMDGVAYYSVMAPVQDFQEDTGGTGKTFKFNLRLVD